MKDGKHEPKAVGLVLEHKFMIPRGITHQILAEALGMHRNSVYRITKGKQPLMFDIAVKLAGLFGTEPGYFIMVNAKREAWLAVEELKKMEIEPLKNYLE